MYGTCPGTEWRLLSDRCALGRTIGLYEMTLWTCGSNVSGAFSNSRKWVLSVPVDHFVSQLAFLNLCRRAMCGWLFLNRRYVYAP